MSRQSSRAWKAQFGRVETTGPKGKLFPACWVAATRWVTDDRGGTPATFLWDPPQDHRPFSEDEAAQHREAMTRAWLSSIAPGLGWRDADELLSPERARSVVVVSAAPGSVPVEEERQTLSDGRRADPVRASGVSKLEIYEASWLLRPTGSQAKPHRSDYIAALVTPFGVRPIQNRSDYETLQRAQERAINREEPAMIIGLPRNLDPAAPIPNGAWLDGAGIARKQDLAVFDLRRVQVELLDGAMHPYGPALQSLKGKRAPCPISLVLNVAFLELRQRQQLARLRRP